MAIGLLLRLSLLILLLNPFDAVECGNGKFLINLDAMLLWSRSLINRGVKVGVLFGLWFDIGADHVSSLDEGPASLSLFLVLLEASDKCAVNEKTKKNGHYDPVWMLIQLIKWQSINRCGLLAF